MEVTTTAPAVHPVAEYTSYDDEYDSSNSEMDTIRECEHRSDPLSAWFMENGVDFGPSSGVLPAQPRHESIERSGGLYRPMHSSSLDDNYRALVLLSECAAAASKKPTTRCCFCSPSSTVKTAEWTYDDKMHVMNDWRSRALDALASKSAFVFEITTVEECLIQLKIANEEVSLAMDTLPWSMVTGSTVSTRTFPRPSHNSRRHLLHRYRRCVVFSPSRIIRFILQHSNGTPATIVSSQYTNIFHHAKFIDTLVYNKILPGSQKCCNERCNNYAVAVKLHTDGSPKALYCTSHVQYQLIRGQKLLLYNPLFISLAAHMHNLVVSALDLDMVYGPRSNYWSALQENITEIPLPRKWTPLCKKPQIKRTTSTENEFILLETWMNAFEDTNEARERSLIINKYTFGVHKLHAVTTNLLWTFFGRRHENALCGFSPDEQENENVPLDWQQD